MSLNAQKTRGFSPNMLRRIKLRTRLFVTFLIISLVPVITIGIFSYHAYTQSMNEKVKQAALQSIELLNNNMSTQLGIYSDYIGSISVSDTVQNGVASVNNGHPLTSDIVNGIGEMIVTIPFQSTHLKNIRVVSNDRTVIYDLGYDDITHPSVLMNCWIILKPLLHRIVCNTSTLTAPTIKLSLAVKSMIYTTSARRWGISCCTLTNPS